MFRSILKGKNESLLVLINKVKKGYERRNIYILISLL